jgi:hypothetical protein
MNTSPFDGLPAIGVTMSRPLVCLFCRIRKPVCASVAREPDAELVEQRLVGEAGERARKLERGQCAGRGRSEDVPLQAPQSAVGTLASPAIFPMSTGGNAGAIGIVCSHR